MFGNVLYYRRRRKITNMKEHCYLKSFMKPTKKACEMSIKELASYIDYSVLKPEFTEEEIIETCKTAFSGGYTSVKLYFMLGLPTETDEDLQGIAELGQKIVNEFYSMPNKPPKRSVSFFYNLFRYI